MEQKMAIYAPNPEKSDFTPCPHGWQQAVCVDVIDLGMQPGFQGGPPQHKIRLVFQSDLCDEGGRSFVAVKSYTLSLHEKANLLRDLEAWFGRSIPVEERKTLDLESLVGMNAQMLVSHKPKDDGSVFADIKVLAPIIPGSRVMSAKDYTRKKDRPGSISGTTPAERAAIQQPTAAPQTQPQALPPAAPAPAAQPVAQPAPAPAPNPVTTGMPWEVQQPAAAAQPAETVEQLRARLRSRLQTLSQRIPGPQLVQALQQATGVGSLDAAALPGLQALDVALNAFEAPSAAVSNW